MPSSRPSPKGASLTIYVDCGTSLSLPTKTPPSLKPKLTSPTVSPYSWFGITSILAYRSALQAHGVTVDIKPFFLGGARDAVGNPWQPTPKWKEAFSKQDSESTCSRLSVLGREIELTWCSVSGNVRVGIEDAEGVSCVEFICELKCFLFCLGLGNGEIDARRRGGSFLGRMMEERKKES